MRKSTNKTPQISPLQGLIYAKHHQKATYGNVVRESVKVGILYRHSSI